MRTEYRENSNHYLFANRNNSPIRRQSNGIRTLAVQEKLGISSHWHSAFRHAAAVSFSKKERHSLVVQRQLRHGDAKTTYRNTVHVVGDSQRRAINSLAEKNRTPSS